ncbi:MAG: hypothetical protein WBD40_01415 [Tepidisphaeraceae bacterium]
MSATLDYFLPYQLEWINDPSPFSLGEKSRRVGWTYAHSYRRVDRAVRNICNGYFSSADLTASREFIDYCKTWSRVFNVVATAGEEEETIVVGDPVTGAVIDERKMTTQVLTFANGRKIVAGSSNPVFFRSKGGDADGDEFAYHRAGRDLLKAMHATALFWGYHLRLWSTHNGPNSYFNQLILAARAGKLNARVHRVTIHDAVEQGLVEKIKKLAQPDPKARQEWLDELRSTCPDQDTWNEEYLCIPADDASSLLSYELITANTIENLTLVESPNDLSRDKGDFYAGYDVGRRHDFSALWVAERVGDVLWTRMFRCLDRASFPAQESLINALMANRRVRRICIDEQGIGAQLAENAMRRFGSRAEGVSLSAPVKTSLGLAFRDRFIDRQVRLPAYVDWEEFDDQDPINRVINRRDLRIRRHRDDWLKEDLHKTKKSVTAAGNVRLAAESDSDGHADGFWAGALMNEAAGSKSDPVPAPLEELPPQLMGL